MWDCAIGYEAFDTEAHFLQEEFDSREGLYVLSAQERK